MPHTFLEWCTSTTAFLAMVGAVRLFVVRPLLRGIGEFVEEAKRARNAIDTVERELAPNGESVYLPPEERGYSIRKLTVLNRVGLVKVESMAQDAALKAAEAADKAREAAVLATNTHSSLEAFSAKYDRTTAPGSNA